ncbi:NADPH-dependent 7-cyano-7-deazaguanine reductase QueF [Alcanivorax quisquiliarum]|uniref:NADPH-dependent 7-cyano-7-deazaguanine reductase n=1 Tax=Alcanivorax quisquiliarum TaxID=2933565 RepID=A0ABT0EAK8_9GAMM|nr:NADPH-dependent 7-cyano-7-deazaguanine reductase QueF [Alcanivorax quisquiliarum]MCK0538849.1 NADPH-dependent 7-cyano-7-deazaguanine reductase QueF [Alcanivorax quisquiliarum]
MSNPFSDTPLGRKTEYLDQYTPSLLCPIPRWDAREELELDAHLPFHGMDVWNAYELSWLDNRGKPVVAMAEIRVACVSRNLIESKSLKLYLNSFANTRFADRRAVQQAIEKDLGHTADGPVDVRVLTLEEAARQPAWEPQGTLLDGIELEVEGFEPDASLLMTEQGAERTEVVYSHLLRSRCPVTAQPDWATVIIRYTGAPISHASLLRYLISFRNHDGFHEQVIEQIFLDIQRQCAPRQLSVNGRFTRRGGLDINPFRSNFEELPANLRVVRQ